MQEEMNKRLDEMFEYTDFGGDIGGFILRVKEDSYDTEETLRNKLKSFLQSEIDLAVAEERKRIVDKIVKDVDMTDQQLQDVLSLLTPRP